MSGAKQKTGANAKVGKRLNPPFAPEIVNIGSPNNQYGHGRNFRRGWIAPNLSYGPAYVNGIIQFLYNPAQFSVSHAMDANMPGADQISQWQSDPNLTGSDAQALANTLASVGDLSFSLLFDRTYEMHLKRYNGKAVQRWGCYVDVMAFYLMFGIIPASGNVTGDTLDPGVLAYGDPYPRRPLTGIPICNVFLGKNSLAFVGQLTSLNISYTHFAHNMVPMRCAIDVDFRLYNATYSGGAGTSDQNSTVADYNLGNTSTVPPTTPPTQPKPGSQ